MTPTLHFTAEEFADRKAKLVASMAEHKLDGMLCFAQESMYWLTGFDTFGFCFFQCLYVAADGESHLLTRSADLRQAQKTSNIADIRIWVDGKTASPASDLRAMLEDLGAQNHNLGIETETHGLTYANGAAVFAALEGMCRLTPANGLIAKLRSVKSLAEIDYTKKAAALGDQALEAGLAETKPGADEGDILAAMQGAVFAGGGDYPGNEFIIGSGTDALLCRYKSGRRVLEPQDQLTLEFAGVYRHYHAALMRTVLLGEPSAHHLAMFEAARTALSAVEAEFRPGRTAGDAYAAHARALDDAGFGDTRLNACGYSLGARFTPSWMDTPMLYQGNDWELEANMIFFVHIILMDSTHDKAMSLGRTYLLNQQEPQSLSQAPLDLIVKKV